MITAIVLAAGKSKRFGKSNKLLASYKKNLVLNYTLNKILKSKVDEVLLVTGYQNNKIQNQYFLILIINMILKIKIFYLVF